jgi:3-oxo-5-alpha-steroid 4-dehydrogenase 1
MSGFNIFILVWIALALGLVPVQLFVTAPYGRHIREGWGPRISNKFGWFAMEIVSLIVFAVLFLGGPTQKSAPMWIFFALWIAHYANRSLIFPWRVRTSGKTIPLAIVASAIGFNVVNAGLNGFCLGWLAPAYPLSWLADPRFVCGIALFFAGAATNIWADNKLITLRHHGGADYSIPRGGWFEYISCPNLLGEVVEWLGFALMCWNLPALSFAIWTAANLVPRAVSHHRWYHEHFADYPKGRAAIVPGIL